MSKHAQTVMLTMVIIILAIVQGYIIRYAQDQMGSHIVLDGKDCTIENTMHGGQNLFGPQTPGDEVLVFAHCP